MALHDKFSSNGDKFVNVGKHAVSTPALSICVPTFNRADCLPALFDSILANISELTLPWQVSDIEIVVTDNASTDCTGEIINYYCSRFARFVYVRHPENMGADRNFLAAIASASGGFCWLMGSDDKIELGALQRVLEATRAWHNAAGFSVAMVPYDADLQVRAPLGKGQVRYSGDQLVTGADNIFRDFGVYLGFISAQIIRRDLWNAVCAGGEQLNFLNAYVHVLVIGRMIQQVPTWGYIHTPCVGWRGGNDSFSDDGWVRRLEIDLLGYRAVTRALFGEGHPVVADVRDRLAEGHNLSQYRHAKLRGESATSLHRAAQLLRTHLALSPVYRRKILPWILTPRWLAHGSYIAYRRIARPFVRRVRLLAERRRSPD
ncbi:glycosyltransferase family 2 protein [Sphingomonas ginsenosidivorax]|nr:glycosyltransferase family 2 protein [Sphingomonas ginsenosidivorax]